MVTFFYFQGHGKPTSHKPEVMLNNFSTRLGHTVGRMFASLFPHHPQFKGRQVVTFHNQRDFIFFRYHRYMAHLYVQQSRGSNPLTGIFSKMLSVLGCKS